MEREVKEESHKRFPRREILQAALVAVAAGAVSKITSKPQGLEKESVTPKVTSLPTASHDVVFISSPHQEPTPAARENIAAEAKPPVVAETNPLVEEEAGPLVTPKESVSEYNLLDPEVFAPYAGFGGPETPAEEALDYFPQSYQDAPDGLKGLWSRAIDAKLR
ncbi:MAG: hypothetical protein PHP73_07495, partial [Candidatus Omnitrophica bacterium]|nr:hypothetical protein [Candidatus Omnitrophota bacterium]